MNTTIAIATGALIVVAGVVGFISGLAVQRRRKLAYFIAESTVTNPQEDARVISQLPATTAHAGGRYLARRGRIVAYEGEPPSGLVIVAFDSLETIRAWREMAKVKELERLRKQAGTTLRMYAVEGVDQ